MKSLGRHLIDYAGSGVVITGFLLAALALSAAPSAMSDLAAHLQPVQVAAAGVH